MEKEIDMIVQKIPLGGITKLEFDEEASQKVTIDQSQSTAQQLQSSSQIFILSKDIGKNIPLSEQVLL